MGNKIKLSKKEQKTIQSNQKYTELMKQLQDKIKSDNPPSKRFGYTKVFGIYILFMNTLLFVFALAYAWTYQNVSFLERLMIVWGGEMSLITGFIVWKAKQENVAKIKGFYDVRLKEMDNKSQDVQQSGDVSETFIDSEFQSNLIELEQKAVLEERYTDDI